MARPPLEEPDSGLEPRLDDRVLAILGGTPGEITFNGMRRALEAHPESLTRALRRLSRDGLVTRDTGGYRLGESALAARSGPGPLARPLEPARALVAEVRLPRTEPVPELLGRLAGRWFGRLRWVGTYDRAREPLLVWSRVDGPGQLLLGLRPGHLRVYTEPPPATLGAASRGLEEAARQLLWHALGLLAESPSDWSDRTATDAGASPARRPAN
jgi:DNA-binding transcriptional ArsR family regulator